MTRLRGFLGARFACATRYRLDATRLRRQTPRGLGAARLASRLGRTRPMTSFSQRSRIDAPLNSRDPSSVGEASRFTRAATMRPS
jgi:hypothetical protein